MKLMKTLFIVPYKHLFPPRNGGMLRNYHLVQELAKFSNLTLLVLQNETDFRNGQNNYEWNNSIRIISPVVSFQKNTFFRNIINSVKGRYYRKRLFESSNIFLLQTYPVLKNLLKSEKFDVVIYAHLQSLSLEPLIRKYNSKALNILDAHNVDHLLYFQENERMNAKQFRHYKRLKKQESSLYKKVNMFMSCSLEDKEVLETINGFRLEGFIIPNGADTNRLHFQKHKNYTEKRVLFCGTLDYLPNRDGLIWFYINVWVKLTEAHPDLILTVIGRNGSSSDYDVLRHDSSVEFEGDVESVLPFYYKSIIAIVPLHKGSGTRLKILEAMCLGCPVVSTSIGAQGIDFEHLVNISIADTDQEMFDSINYLLSNPVKCNFLRDNARKLIVEKYSWNGIGIQLAQILENRIHKNNRTKFSA